MRRDAEGHVQQTAQPHRIERRASGEVSVDVLVSRASHAARDGSDRRQRPYLLLPSPASPGSQIPNHADRVTDGEPGKVEQLAPGRIVFEIARRQVPRSFALDV